MSAAVMRLPLPRGRAGADQLPPFLRNLPKHCAPGKTYVYAVFFSGGIVKIGQTKSPRSRLVSTSEAARARRREFTCLPRLMAQQRTALSARPERR